MNPIDFSQTFEWIGMCLRPEHPNLPDAMLKILSLYSNNYSKSKENENYRPELGDSFPSSSRASTSRKSQLPSPSTHGTMMP